MDSQNIFSFVESFVFTIAAGDALSLPVVGSFVYVDGLTAGASVVLEGGNARVPLRDGRRIEFSRKSVGGLVLRNTGGASATGTLLIGDGDIRDAAVTGSVAVTNFPASVPVETRESRVAAGGEFLVQAESVTGGSLNFWTFQLFNPLGSGKNVFVLSAYTEDGSPHIRRHDVAISGTPKTPVNLKLGGAAGVLEVRDTEQTAAIGTLIQAYVGPYNVRYNYPWMIAPGQGLVFQRASSGASDSKGAFEWSEVAV